LGLALAVPPLAASMLRPPDEMKLKLDELLEAFAAGAGWLNEYGGLIRDKTCAVHEAVLELVQGGYLSGRLWGLRLMLCSRAAPRLPCLCSHCHWQPLRPRAPVTAAFTVMPLSRLPPPPDSMPMEQMYIQRTTKPGQRPSYLAVRGTSQLESYHHHLAALLPGTNYREGTAEMIITMFNYRCVGRAGRLLPPPAHRLPPPAACHCPPPVTARRPPPAACRVPSAACRPPPAAWRRPPPTARRRAPALAYPSLVPPPAPFVGSHQAGHSEPR
jgi:hypothetical protein